MRCCALYVFFFFFNDTATTEIYTLSLHDALPISFPPSAPVPPTPIAIGLPSGAIDRKCTRLNSSHVEISYAVFCLKKKKKNKDQSAQKKTKKTTKQRKKKKNKT